MYDGDYQTCLDLLAPSDGHPHPSRGTALGIIVDRAPPGNELAVIQTIDQLLAWGANIDTRDDGGMSALHKVKNPKLVAHLLKRGANMRGPDLTPLQMANSLPIIEVFMLHGAKPDEFKAACFRTTPEREAHITAFYNRILAARRATLVFIGLRKKCPLFDVIGKDPAIQLAKTIYQTRGDVVWEKVVP